MFVQRLGALAVIVVDSGRCTAFDQRCMYVTVSITLLIICMIYLIIHLVVHVCF